MPGAAVLLFDPETDATVRAAWAALADAGVSRAMLAPGFRPHLTLSVGADLDLDRVATGLRDLPRDRLPLSVGLPGLGVFTDTGTVYASVTPTAGLLEMHAGIDAICADAGSPEPWYRPDGWVPHVTLAFALDPEGLARSIRVLAGQPWKLAARAESLALVEGDMTGWRECRTVRPGGIE